MKVYHKMKANSIILLKKEGVKMYEKFACLLVKFDKTTYQVAKDTGIGQNVFSNWKTGRSKPKFDKLLILARYFGVPVEYFAEESEA